MGEKSPHGLLLDPTNATNHEKPHYHKPSKKKKKKKKIKKIWLGQLLSTPCGPSQLLWSLGPPSHS